MYIIVEYGYKNRFAKPSLGELTRHEYINMVRKAVEDEKKFLNENAYI